MNTKRASFQKKENNHHELTMKWLEEFSCSISVFSSRRLSVPLHCCVPTNRNTEFIHSTSVPLVVNSFNHLHKHSQPSYSSFITAGVCVCVRLCAPGWWMRVCEWQNLKWSPAPQKRVLPVGSFHLEKRGVRCHNGTHTQNTCTRIHDEWISRWSATQKQQQQSSLSELRNPLISLWFRRKFPELLFDIITQAAWKPSAHLPDCLGCYSNPLWKKSHLNPAFAPVMKQLKTAQNDAQYIGDPLALSSNIPVATCPLTLSWHSPQTNPPCIGC